MPLPRRARIALALEIAATYAGVRVGLRRRDLRQLVVRLRRPSPLSGPLAACAGVTDGLRLGRAVVLALSALPADSRCLVRSLVLLRLLSRRGLAADLVIAVQDPAAVSTVGAHAWVEQDGRPLLWTGDEGYHRLATL